MIFPVGRKTHISRYLNLRNNCIAKVSAKIFRIHITEFGSRIDLKKQNVIFKQFRLLLGDYSHRIELNLCENVKVSIDFGDTVTFG